MSAIPTALEAGKARYDRKHLIPPITDPMGKHWTQPTRWNIETDDTHAMMSKTDFDQLATYSATLPTGVYEGKMWKCEVGAHDPRVKPEDRYFLLVWYGPHEKPGHCSINTLRILVV